MRHEQGELLDSIVAWLDASGLLSDSTPAMKAALASIGSYRRSALPGAHWDATSLNLALLVNWGAGFKRPALEIMELLSGRFGMPLTAPEVAEMATAEEPRPLNALIADLAKEEPSLEALIREVDAGAERDSRSMSEFGRSNESVVALARTGRLLAAATAIAKGDATESQPDPTPAQLEKLIAPLSAAARDWIAILTPLEVDLARTLSAGEQVLRRAVAANAKLQLATALFPTGGSGVAWVLFNGLSDRVGETTLVADWLATRTLSAGGRAGLFGWGPTAYAWIALEPHDPEVSLPLQGLGIGIPEEREWLDFVITLEAEDGPIAMDYRAGRDLETLRWLATLILTRRLMFDIFLLREDGLHLGQRMSMPVSEFADLIRDNVVEALKGYDLGVINLPSEDENAVAGFFATENAKSELLLQLTPLDTDAPELEEARKKLLEAEVTRAHAVNVGSSSVEIERQLEVVRRVFIEQRRQCPPLVASSSGDRSARISEFATGMATEGRVLVQYNLHESHVVAFWVASGGTARGWIQGDAVDLHALETALRPWYEHRAGDVHEILTAGAGLASELHGVLSDLRAKEVVISPWSLLHGIPWAALPLDGVTFGDLYQVSYTPSFSILRQLCGERKSRPRGITLIGAEQGWLPWADAEISAARAIYEDGADVVPANTPQHELVRALGNRRLLHVAAHGSWWADDHLATAVWLQRQRVCSSFLTAADVHSGADLRGTELVLLATCDSGRGVTGRRGVELYNGLDGAFLAQGARAVVSTMWPISDFASFLFTTNLHTRLCAGESLISAFADSVRLLRDGRYEAIDSRGTLGNALSAAGADWRREIEEVGSSLTGPEYWAPFRLSGAHWLSRI